MTAQLANPWFSACIVLASAILFSAAHILKAFFGQVKLNPGGPGFENAPGFSEDACLQLENHYQRIQGTLGFWKKQAIANGRLFQHSVLWSILAAVGLPVLIGEYDSSNLWAKVLLISLSAWTGLLTAFNRGFKAEELHRSFRQCESDFYDARRRLLDRPYSFGNDERDRLDRYFEAVEKIRQYGRDSETSNFPSARV